MGKIKTPKAEFPLKFVLPVFRLYFAVLHCTEQALVFV